MAASLRPFVTCALPGVLVLLASWWYTSRRRRCRSHKDGDPRAFQPGVGGGGDSTGQLHEEVGVSRPESMQGSSKVWKRPEPEGGVTPGWKSASDVEGSWSGAGPGNFILQQSEQQHVCLEVAPPSGHWGNLGPGEGVCRSSEEPHILSCEDVAGENPQEVQEQDRETGRSWKPGMALPAPIEAARETEKHDCPFDTPPRSGSEMSPSGSMVLAAGAAVPGPSPRTEGGCGCEDPMVSPAVPEKDPVALQTGHSRDGRGSVSEHPPGAVPLLWDVPVGDAGPGSSPPAFPPSPRVTDLVEWEVAVPRHLVGRLIGQKGRAVSFLKRRSGAKIYVFRACPSRDVQICHIEGSRVQVDRALKLIGEKFADLDLTNHSAALDLTQPSLPTTSWVALPEAVAVEVIVVKVASAGHLFLQQHTHPSHHSLHKLDERMYLCYAQRGVPYLHAHIQVGTLCAAPGLEGSWWRAQVSALCDDPTQVEVRYVDYGGYEKVKVDALRQIRSDFVALPFQAAEVLLDNLAPLPEAENYSAEATSRLEDLTRGATLIAQVTRSHSGGLPLVQMWKTVRNKLVSVNQMLAEEQLCSWVDAA